MNAQPRYVYQGDGKTVPPARHPDSPAPEPYIAEPALARAVNLAIHLSRPLLVEGEAGCGKTRLARSVAAELGLPFYAWYVRSTSTAQDGFYTYDAILRLHDVHLRQLNIPAGQPNVTSPSPARDPSRATDYRTLGALGKAFDMRACPAVVLIDEIDKADVDFPNDLLTVLDDPWEFPIRETGEIKRADRSAHPIVIITSNKEKGNLPAPFLRRCLYYYLQFPDTLQRLQEIVNVHYAAHKETPPSPELVTAAATRFLNVRSQENLFKNPGTSEFLDWLRALHTFTTEPYPSKRLQDAAETALPYPGILFKLRADLQRYTTP